MHHGRDERYQPSEKAAYIEGLFASIAPRYDLLNSVLSLSRHKYWRKFAARQCRLSPGDRALDVCAGTLDLTIELSREVGPSGEIVAVDFCRPMLEIGRAKLQKLGIGNISLLEGDAQDLPVSPGSFKAATIGFALRNVTDVERTLAEMTRAVEHGGRVVCLELMRPRGRLLGMLYRFYARHVMPALGALISGSRDAYEYLPESVERFYSREELARIMENVGLADVTVYDLTGGVAAVHTGIKK